MGGLDQGQVRPEDSLGWLYNLGVTKSGELEKYFDIESDFLSKNKENKGLVVDTLVKIGVKIADIAFATVKHRDEQLGSEVTRTLRVTKIGRSQR